MYVSELIIYLHANERRVNGVEWKQGAAKILVKLVLIKVKI